MKPRQPAAGAFARSRLHLTGALALATALVTLAGCDAQPGDGTPSASVASASSASGAVQPVASATIAASGPV
ncbi:MAG TPA: cytochrome-c peroxidase, partial [Burkholderia sp.]|nr:cytochrome-c peroxidase [Burkholderia sp.]